MRSRLIIPARLSTLPPNDKTTWPSIHFMLCLCVCTAYDTSVRITDTLVGAGPPNRGVKIELLGS